MQNETLKLVYPQWQGGYSGVFQGFKAKQGGKRLCFGRANFKFACFKFK